MTAAWILALGAVCWQAHEVKASPFDGIRWVGAAPEVLVGSEWYEPLAIDGVLVEDILSFCERRWPGKSKKRFGEDLVEALDGMDWEGDLEVALDLKQLRTGERVHLDAVRMTLEKRQAIWQAGQAQKPELRASPFDGLRWTEASPEVLVAGAWYAPRAIDGIPVEGILATCQRHWPGLQRKRFGEDLVEVLALMGWDGDLRVELDLIRLSDGASIRLEDVEMTAAKRDAIRDAGRSRERSAPAAPLSAEAARREVDSFELGLRARFAYLRWRGVDLDAALNEVRASLTEPTEVSELALSLQRVLMKFGDGHAEVLPPITARQLPSGYLPFLLAMADGRVVAFWPDRSALVEPTAPYVTAIDDIPLAEWTHAVEGEIPRGSPQLVALRSLRALREIGQVRERMHLPPRKELRVTFTDLQRELTTTRSFELSAARPRYGIWPQGASRILAGNVGYLRIAVMDDREDDLRTAMSAFAETTGLIVDVRGNGGGSRQLLRVLAGYLIAPESGPVVVSVAKYRLAPEFGKDHLEARFMHPASWPGWSPAQHDAIDDLAARFRPEWTPRAAANVDGFSDWHYLVLDRTGHPDEFAYTRPVVVLSDAACFSATDVFLGALHLFRQVTILGTASSGGSARSQSFRLPESGIEVRCASMASFRPDGRLYDGRGIEVDREVLPGATSFIAGGDDNQLQSAVDLLLSED